MKKEMELVNISKRHNIDFASININEEEIRSISEGICTQINLFPC